MCTITMNIIGTRFMMAQHVSTRINWANHKNLLSLSRELAISKPSEYAQYLGPSQKLAKLVADPDNPRQCLIEDWNDLDETVCEFGSPEFADHMSGHVYMQGTIHEDKSSKGIRVAQLVPHLDNHELERCLESCQMWPANTVMDSQVLQILLQSLDQECLSRSKKDNNMDLKMAFLLCNIMATMWQKCQFVPATLEQQLKLVQEGMSNRDLVTVLLLA